MIDLIKRVMKEEHKVGFVTAGTCEWGELHHFELTRTDEWPSLATYRLYIEEESEDPYRFGIEFTGELIDILITLEAIDNIYVVEEE